MTDLNYLRIPMQMLRYDVLDVDAFAGLPPEKTDLLWVEYTEDELGHIVAALKFAVDHPDFDFLSLIPDLRQSNHSIHRFLCKIDVSISQAIEARKREA